jgi:hypothetical protein
VTNTVDIIEEFRYTVDNPVKIVSERVFVH